MEINKYISKQMIKYIVWIQKINDCLEVCTKSTGCSNMIKGDMHRICKINNIDSYNKLNKLFE